MQAPFELQSLWQVFFWVLEAALELWETCSCD
jgi:hypothetical protein